MDAVSTPVTVDVPASAAMASSGTVRKNTENRNFIGGGLKPNSNAIQFEPELRSGGDTASTSARATSTLAVMGRYDAVLVLGFGGPERREDVIPFLENVLRG